MPQPAFNLVVEPPWTAADSEPTQMILVKSPAHSDSQFTGTDFRQYPNHQSVLHVSCDPRYQKIWPDDMSVKSIGVKLRCTGRSSEASVPGLGGTFCKLTPIWVKGTITSLVGPSQSGDTLPRLGEVSRVTLPVDAEFAVQETLICNPARTPGDSLMMANEPVSIA